MKTSFSIKLKFTLFFAIFVIAIFSVTLVDSILDGRKLITLVNSRMGVPIAERAMTYIDGDAFERLTKSLDPDDPFYEETRKKFKNLKEESRCLYIYTMAPYTKTVHRFIIDGGEPGEEGFSPLGSEEDIRDYTPAYLRTYATKEPQYGEMNLQDSWGWLISTYMPVLNSAGDVVGVLACDFEANSIYKGIVSNIYQQVIFVVVFLLIGAFLYRSLLRAISRQNENLLEMNKKAMAASEAKTAFLANMSHEIRTPMNAIIGMTSIGKSSPGIEKKDYCLGRIETASIHLLGIINDILDMSKIEADKMELASVSFDFKAMIRKVVNVIDFRVNEKQQELSVSIDDNIPKALIGDDQRLAQVLTNILGNAVKFTPKGGRISLDARFMEEKDGVCFIRFGVTDTGIGISEEQQGRLFSSFQQANSGTSREFGGTGLGLAISKRIVEMMGGKIWIESEMGKGATFSFTIAMTRGNQDFSGEITPGGEFPRNEDEQNNFEGYRLLLAEDVEINREIVMSLLEPTRITIECAKNGEEAVKLFSEAPDLYDVIFMDLQMPKMDGYEAARRIREIAANQRVRDLPIIAMTANVFREDVEKCMKAGMNAHVGKPLNFDEVLSVLRFYLKSYEDGYLLKG